MLEDILTVKEDSCNSCLSYRAAHNSDLLAALHTQGHAVLLYLTMKVTAPQYFATAETTCPSTQHKITED
jgi:hypothetical protein